MATEFDVAARLAEGRQAVDNTQSYVWAAHLLGYQNPDLTLHSAQIRDWFSSEDGMDLRVLDADSSAVRAVADAADDVAARQRDQLAALTAAWQGEGAASAEEFLRRHCDAAEQVAASARTAAQALAGLRDTLWQIVDTKVAAVGAIDDRRRAERPAWLSAAQTVITGAGDRAAASELVDQQVKPFVDNDIRNDWLTAMHTAIASIATSYDAATAEMTPASPVRFELPGDFGPDSAPPAHDEVAPRHDSAPATGAATTSSPPAAAPSYPAAPAMSTPAMSTPAMSTPAVSTPAMSATPAGLPTASATPTPTTLPTSPSSGLDGLGQGFGDALRGLLPSSADGTVPDMPAVDAPTLDDPPTDRPMEDEPDDKADDEADEADETSDESDCDPEGDTGPDDPIPTAVDDAAAAEPPPPAETPPPPEAPVPAPQAAPPESPTDAPVAGSSTPCEIAADELPQAGQ